MRSAMTTARPSVTRSSATPASAPVSTTLDPPHVAHANQSAPRSRTPLSRIRLERITDRGQLGVELRHDAIVCALSSREQAYCAAQGPQPTRVSKAPYSPWQRMPSALLNWLSMLMIPMSNAQLNKLRIRERCLQLRHQRCRDVVRIGRDGTQWPGTSRRASGRALKGGEGRLRTHLFTQTLLSRTSPVRSIASGAPRGAGESAASHPRSR